MSRIGKAPITVPSGVDVAVEGQQVTVKGPKGTLSHTVDEPIGVSVDDGVSRWRAPTTSGRTVRCTACRARCSTTSCRA